MDASPWRQPTACTHLIMHTVYSVYQQHSELPGSDTLRETHAGRLRWADSLCVPNAQNCWFLLFARAVGRCRPVTHTVSDRYPFSANCPCFRGSHRILLAGNQRKSTKLPLIMTYKLLRQLFALVSFCSKNFYTFKTILHLLKY